MGSVFCEGQGGLTEKALWGPCLGRENSWCKGPEVGLCLAWVRKSREASMAGVQCVWCVCIEGGVEQEMRPWVGGSRSVRALWTMRRPLAYTLGGTGATGAL